MPPTLPPTPPHPRWKIPHRSAPPHPPAHSAPAPRHFPLPAVAAHQQLAAAPGRAAARSPFGGGPSHPFGFCLRLWILPFCQPGRRCCFTPTVSQSCGGQCLYSTDLLRFSLANLCVFLSV